MNRLILIPQYPAHLRYQEWWIKTFTEQLRDSFSEIIVLGYNMVDSITSKKGEFSPITKAIEFELEQIKTYMLLELKEGDVLLLNDISFPGLFSQVLLHKRPKKCYAICHATSKNKYDYFSADRHIKYPTEKATAKLFNKILIATKYHKKKLNWPNSIVTALPDPPFLGYHYYPKKYTISVASRKHIQKRNTTIENKVQKQLNITIHNIDSVSWLDYYMQLSDTKIILITANEETYGYQVVDAILSGCIVLAPNAYSYPELLAPEFLYDSYTELITKLKNMIYKEDITLPTNLMQDKVNNFFNTLKNILNE